MKIDIGENDKRDLLDICNTKGISIEEGVSSAIQRYIEVWKLGTNLRPLYEKNGKRIYYGSGSYGGIDVGG